MTWQKFRSPEHFACTSLRATFKNFIPVHSWALRSRVKDFLKYIMTMNIAGILILDVFKYKEFLWTGLIWSLFQSVLPLLRSVLSHLRKFYSAPPSGEFCMCSARRIQTFNISLLSERFLNHDLASCSGHWVWVPLLPYNFISYIFVNKNFHFCIDRLRCERTRR